MANNVSLLAGRYVPVAAMNLYDLEGWFKTVLCSHCIRRQFELG